MTNTLMQTLEPLIGTWEVVLTKARFFEDPDETLTGSIRLSREMDGTVVVMRQTINDPRFPVGQWVIGGDDSHKTFAAMYSDTRAVQRLCRMDFDGRNWRIWRDAPGFSQTFTGELHPDGTRIEVELEYCENGTDWHRDFCLSLTRCSQDQLASIA